MSRIQYTLLTDGSSDRVLIPVLNWLLNQSFPEYEIEPKWAELRTLRKPPKKLAERILASFRLYPCMVLFVHRDAENISLDERRAEIEQAVDEITKENKDLPPAICVIPVRMQEAWLLFDEAAIRRAADKPNGRMKLELPRLRDLEDVPNPKQVLNNVLIRASELKGRHLEKFERELWPGRVADLIEDFSPLRVLPAFQTLETDIQQLSF